MKSELDGMTDKQRIFCLEYLTDLNGTRAAIKAGYSQNSAAEIASENLRKPQIRQFIDNQLREKVISSEETVKLISDIAKSSINDYLTTRIVEDRKKINKPLRQKIEELQEEIAKKRRLQELSDWTEERSDDNFKEIARIEEEIIQYEVELEFNPDASIIEFGKPELVERIEVDMVKLAKDKELGRIKSIAWTEFGPKVELYAADAALRDMAKIYGKFEKDNAQKQPVVNVASEEKIDALLNKLK